MQEPPHARMPPFAHPPFPLPDPGVGGQLAVHALNGRLVVLAEAHLLGEWMGAPCEGKARKAERRLGPGVSHWNHRRPCVDGPCRTLWNLQGAI